MFCKIYSERKALKKKNQDINKTIKKIRNDFMQKKNNILLGKTEKQEIGIGTENKIYNSNVLVIGFSGTGKSYNHIVSNLLQSDTSAVVTDIFGSIVKDKEIFLDKGYEVYCFSEYTDELLKAIDHISRKKGIIFLCGKNTAKLLPVVLDTIYSDKSRKEKEYICFYLDNFSDIGITPELIYEFICNLACLRHYNAGFQIVVSSINQLKKSLYNEHETIVCCCDAVLFTGSHDSATIGFIQKIADISIFDIPNDLIQGKKNLVCIRGVLAVLCDKLNPDNYKTKKI